MPHPCGTNTIPALTITAQARRMFEMTSLTVAATEPGNQSDTATRSLTLATAATTARGLYVAATRGRDDATSTSREALGHSGYAPTMASKIWTAAELEQMSPAERKAIFDASIVKDLADAPPEFVARVRSRVERIIAESESTNLG